jgi:AcrR family transcriptional regulator
MLPQPRKMPKQARARQAVEAIEQACLKILEKEGAQRLTTNRIAEVAGVNIASLYQYFPNKEAILASVYAAKVRTEIDAIIRRSPVLEEIANQSLEDALRGLIQSYVDSRRRLAHLDAEFYGRYQAIFDVNLRREANQQAVLHGRGTFDRWFLAILKRNRARLRVTDLALANFVVTRTIEGLIRLAVEERPDLLDSPAFQEEILALLRGYLVVSPD